MQKILIVIISFFISYIFVFSFFFFTIETNFEKNFQIKETTNYYKKYFDVIEHIRYKEKFRFEKKSNELIFNYIKKESGDKIILFQGDSWMNHLNKYLSSQKILKIDLKKYNHIINAGTTSYSPSLMYKQFKILENEFLIFPETIIVYIDQTDMGDELCRYKHLIKYDNNGDLKAVPGEKFPLYQDVFNLHEKISLSLIEHNEKNKVFKTQLLINYKIKKSYIKTKKKLSSYFGNSQKNKKCEWQVIENYKRNISKQDRKYLINLLRKYFLYLSSRNYLKEIYIVTHPHKLQLVSNTQPNDISNIVSTSIQEIPKIKHINFSKILKKENIYGEFENIWKDDLVHLKERNYNIFLTRLLKSIEK